MWSVSRVVAAPPDRVWDLLTDLEAWPVWGPTVTGGSIDGPASALALGVRGHVRTLAGISLPFVVTAYDVSGGVRRWSWSVAGVPATTHEVVELDRGCRVRFGVPVWAPGYLAVCAVALRRIERLAAG